MFFLLIVFGAMFVVNLIIAVIYDSYERKGKEVKNKIARIDAAGRELDDLDAALIDEGITFESKRRQKKD